MPLQYRCDAVTLPLQSRCDAVAMLFRSRCENFAEIPENEELLIYTDQKQVQSDRSFDMSLLLLENPKLQQMVSYERLLSIDSKNCSRRKLRWLRSGVLASSFFSFFVCLVVCSWCGLSILIKVNH